MSNLKKTTSVPKSTAAVGPANLTHEAAQTDRSAAPETVANPVSTTSSRSTSTRDHMAVGHATSQISLTQSLQKIMLGMRALAPKAEQSIGRIAKLRHKLVPSRKNQRPSSPIMDLMEEYQIASESFDKLHFDRAKPSGGIKELWVSGSIVLPQDSKFAWLTSILNDVSGNPRKYSPGDTIRFSDIDLSVFSKIGSANQLKLLVHTMSRPLLYNIGLQTQNGHHLKSPDNGKQQGKIRLTSLSGVISHISQNQSVRVRASTMLALRALAENKPEIAGRNQAASATP